MLKKCTLSHGKMPAVNVVRCLIGPYLNLLDSCITQQDHLEQGCQTWFHRRVINSQVSLLRDGLLCVRPKSTLYHTASIPTWRPRHAVSQWLIRRQMYGRLSGFAVDKMGFGCGAKLACPGFRSVMAANWRHQGLQNWLPKDKVAGAITQHPVGLNIYKDCWCSDRC